MKKKKRDTELEKIFNLIFQGKKEDFDKLSETENPDDILSLISKYKKLAAAIKSSGGSGLDEVLAKISKLKIILSNLHKKKRQQMLDLHWNQIREENDRFIKKLNEQLSGKSKLKVEK